MKRPHLLPCPFCGATPHWMQAKTEHCQLHGEPYQDAIIRCPHLCASMQGSPDAVATRWNTRAETPTPPLHRVMGKPFQDFREARSDE